MLFVATAAAGDEEMRQRIDEHQRARPAAWSTLEVTTDIGSQITQKIGKAQVVIVDCITLLVNNISGYYADQTGEQIDASFITVTNEVGLGLVPANRLGRLYRDLLGKVNQILAQHADEVYLMVAGIPVPIKPAFLRHG